MQPAIVEHVQLLDVSRRESPLGLVTNACVSEKRRTGRGLEGGRVVRSGSPNSRPVIGIRSATLPLGPPKNRLVRTRTWHLTHRRRFRRTASALRALCLHHALGFVCALMFKAFSAFYASLGDMQSKQAWGQRCSACGVLDPASIAFCISQALPWSARKPPCARTPTVGVCCSSLLWQRCPPSPWRTAPPSRARRRSQGGRRR